MWLRRVLDSCLQIVILEDEDDVNAEDEESDEDDWLVEEDDDDKLSLPLDDSDEDEDMDTERCVPFFLDGWLLGADEGLIQTFLAFPLNFYVWNFVKLATYIKNNGANSYLRVMMMNI